MAKGHYQRTENELARSIALGKSNAGRTLSLQHRLNIAKSSVGIWTPEKRARASEYQSGTNNGRWTSGKKAWFSRSILKRDTYTCQKCGLMDNTPGFMEADHIKPRAAFPELAGDLSNGLTLCPNCHKKKTIQDRSLYKGLMYIRRI